MRTVFGGHEDCAPALAKIVSYVRVLGTESVPGCHDVRFFTHLPGVVQLQLLVLGQPWVHQTRPFVQACVHRQPVVFVE